MTELNNAIIAPMGRVAIYDYEVVDADQKIWKGMPVTFPGSPVPEGVAVYFSRRYNKDNDMDRMLEEYEIKNETLMGAKFLLVPKEKLLFAYTPTTSIIRPNLKLRKT